MNLDTRKAAIGSNFSEILPPNPSVIEYDSASGAAMQSKTLPPPPDWAVTKALKLDFVKISWLAGDGSDRCYYRIQNQSATKSYVLMQLSGDDAVMLAKDGYEWLKISELLNRHQIPAPKTIVTMPEFAALIIEDYGDVMMETKVLEALKQDRRDEVLSLYQKALPILSGFIAIQESGTSHWRDRSFDAARFEWELNFFKEQFLEAVLSWHLTPAEAETFRNESRQIADFLAARSHYFVHRDFHSRNIMVKDDRLAVIDFQDARLGPPTYDLVSLCFDSYIPLRKSERLDLAKRGIAHIASTNQSMNEQELAAEIGPMLLQRQLKAIGSFGYLTVKKNRGNYLKNIEPALRTLDADLVADKRWPFISKELVTEMTKRWLEHVKI